MSSTTPSREEALEAAEQIARSLAPYGVNAAKNLATLRAFIESSAPDAAPTACADERDCTQEPWCRIRGKCQRAPAAPAGGEPAAIDMLLYCPACGLQHIDAPDERTPGWKNEPHRSHLCHDCGCIWRPADVPTNGVAAIKTRGKADSPARGFATPTGGAADERRVIQAARDALDEFKQQDDYLLANGASLMSDDSHEIIHVDTLARIVRAALASAPKEGQATSERKGE